MKFDERIIKEKRLIEATKKEYIGSNGIIFKICKYLGDKIVDQGSMYSNFVQYDDFWKNKKEEIEYLDEGAPLTFLGYYFYGLKYSTNLEVMCTENDKKIEVKYNGKTVYREINGDLDCFVPDNAWEDQITRFSLIAKRIEEERKIKDKHNKKEAFEKKKNNILDYIKNKWG